MGDPKKTRKKYSGPGHPWQKKRIEEEKVLLKEYGLKTKKELWKAQSVIKNSAKQAKQLIAAKGLQSEKEKAQLFNRLQKLGLISPAAKMEDILGLTVKDVLEKRIQTVVLRKSLAKCIKQARQFITHGHISIGARKVTAPSYFVTVAEMPDVRFTPTSSLSNPDHPERIEKAPSKEKIEKNEAKR